MKMHFNNAKQWLLEKENRKKNRIKNSCKLKNTHEEKPKHKTNRDLVEHQTRKKSIVS